MRKCRSRLHWITSKGLLLSVHLDHRKNLRSVSLSQSHSNLQTCLCKTNLPQLSFTTDLIGEKMEVVVWGSFRPFISSLRTRGVQMQFSCCCFFSWSTCAEEFGRHFLLQFLLFSLHRWVQPPFCWQKIFTRNRFFSTRKIFFCGFFFLKLKNHVQRFPGRFPQKMQKTGSTVKL